MNAICCWCAVVAVSICGTAVVAQEQKEEQWLIDRALTIVPRAEPSPAFAYRLFPTTTERKDGNAVPIYLRLNFEQSDASRREWRETPAKWNAMAVDKMPLAEAKEFVNKYRNFYRQFELGALRKSAEWNYTLDQEDIIGVLLPDVQSMRGYVPMMLLKARVELAEGHFDAAAHWLKTGFSFSQHVGNGPFLINRLVGIACANQFADCTLDFIEQPNSPNLYWSLTALPRHLIELRDSMELEQQVMELQFSEFVDLDRPRSPEQWDAMLKKVRTEFRRLVQTDHESGDNRFKPIPGTGPDDPAAKSPDLAAAKKFVAERRRLAEDKVDAMPPAQVLLLYIIDTYHVFRDDTFKAAYLPYSEAKRVFAEAEARRKASPDTEARRFPDALLPAISKVIGSQARLERKIAAMRVIEALRLHVAANGALPEQLGDVKFAPIPNDPATGKPFDYKRDGNSATLIGLIPDELQKATGMRYRLTLKK